MFTRAKAELLKANPKYALLLVKTNYFKPKTIKDAFKYPGWNNAMGDEMGNLHVTKNTRFGFSLA